MNYVIIYWVYTEKFRYVTDEDGYAALEERQERGELYIEEVIEAPGQYIPQ